MADKRVPFGNGREANKAIYLGCPNHYSLFDGGGVSYFNYFWNYPHDALTHQISFGIQMLRNMIYMAKKDFKLELLHLNVHEINAAVRMHACPNHLISCTAAQVRRPAQEISRRT